MFILFSHKWFVSYKWDILLDKGSSSPFCISKNHAKISLDFKICPFSKYFIKDLLNFRIAKECFFIISSYPTYSLI